MCVTGHESCSNEGESLNMPCFRNNTFGFHGQTLWQEVWQNDCHSLKGSKKLEISFHESQVQVIQQNMQTTSEVLSYCKGYSLDANCILSCKTWKSKWDGVARSAKHTEGKYTCNESDSSRRANRQTKTWQTSVTDTRLSLSLIQRQSWIACDKNRV